MLGLFWNQEFIEFQVKEVPKNRGEAFVQNVQQVKQFFTLIRLFTKMYNIFYLNICKS